MHPEMAKTISEASRKSIQKGSKTFSLAAAFFGASTYKAATALYAWCRYCDDQIDDSGSSEIALQRLKDLQLQTRGALRGEPSEHLVFQGLSALSRRYHLREDYLLDLLAGMEMDARGGTYSTLEELETYGYHVAGCVGLLMCQIMGVSSAQAYPLASHLGIAMQLTNISRDVREDALQSRLYLPIQLPGPTLGWSKDQILVAAKDPAQNSLIFPLVLQLIDRADDHYDRGMHGLKFLPFRASLAVRTAALFYREIGHQIRRRGPDALNSRSIVSPLRKSWFLVQAVLASLLESHVRLRSPWKLNREVPTWRYP